LILGRAAAEKSKYSEKILKFRYIPLKFSIIQKFRKILVIFPKNPKIPLIFPKILNIPKIPQKSSIFPKILKIPKNPQKSTKILIIPSCLQKNPIEYQPLAIIKMYQNKKGLTTNLMYVFAIKLHMVLIMQL
jgi:hypothetical protein